MYTNAIHLLFASCGLACLGLVAATELGTCDNCAVGDSGDLIDLDESLESGEQHLNLLQKSAQVKVGKDKQVEVEEMNVKRPEMNLKASSPTLAYVVVIVIVVIAVIIPFCLERTKVPTQRPSTKSFCFLVGVFQIIIAIGFYCLGKPPANFYGETAQNTQLYNYYIGVTLMMLVGFGYLMTFNRFYGLGAVGFTMLITCLGMQWAVLVEPIFANGFVPFKVDIMALLNGNFAVAAFLISFGGIIGKVDPSQLLVLTFFEAIFYCGNKQLILVKWLNIADCGGTIIIHMFGAFFGLTVAFILGRPSKMIKEVACTTTDVFAFIGTVFLWLYWPSFVAGGLTPGTVEAETAITNTVLALLGSTVTTFVLSAFLNGRMLKPADIQNATLAGGVSIGAVANLNISPFGAVFIGCLAGELSTIGYCKIQDALKEWIGLHDTCGIHNLHGMPSVLGGLASVLVPLLVEQGHAGALGVPLTQLTGVVLTILVAMVTGTVTAMLMKVFKDDAEGMDDSAYWLVTDDFLKHAQKLDPLAHHNHSYANLK